MKANEYQSQAMRTLPNETNLELSDQQTKILWTALGMTGEAGEVAELVKKGIFHQQGIDKNELKKELGDVLWYLSALCSLMGLNLSEVMESNLEKLAHRYPEGFSPEASQKRVDLH